VVVRAFVLCALRVYRSVDPRPLPHPLHYPYTASSTRLQYNPHPYTTHTHYYPYTSTVYSPLSTRRTFSSISSDLR
jgi:hypothetical protein